MRSEARSSPARLPLRRPSPPCPLTGDDPRPFGDGMDKDVKSVALCFAIRIRI
ncbi:hypothetical protein T4A_46 [Trichinella pseudospiralis]|uniref:Uncharacterized protein n=1 Tax=Trichinella pseudospiralis TaxID=6337 RepID=A0A0V1AM96_TRIPS|nr:hypothetical protein T4A_46 [Trichinella pseudospiralis]